ncbi:MAG: trypsin-like peptidase domain-containing protein [Vulcanimicrobiaceae bacterium]
MDAPAAGTLAALSADIARAVARIGPSIAYVDAHPRRDASGFALDDHHAVTVDHAIDREDEIELRFADGATAQASLVGRDASTDVALLRTDATLVPAPRARAPLAVGHLVIAAGRDEDGAPGASLGIVSALDGPWRTWRGGDVDRFIRPDCNVYPSFSGGPLVDAAGNVIGMNTWGLSRRMALTLPLATIERVATELLARGRVARGYLGLALQTVRLPAAVRAGAGIAQRTGAIVVDVAPGGPAERAGLTIGDVILALGERAVDAADGLQHALAAAGVGSGVTVHFLRGGAVRDDTVTIGERPGDDD